MLAPKLGISHAFRIPRKIVRFGAYLLGNFEIVSVDGTEREHQLFDNFLENPTARVASLRPLIGSTPEQ